MAAINESLWVLWDRDSSGDDYVHSLYRYDIYEGVWTQVYSFVEDSGVMDYNDVAIGWDGAFYVWFCNVDNDYPIYKRVNIVTLAVDDWPAQPSGSYAKPCLNHDYGFKVVSKHIGASQRVWAYHYTTKQWGAFPANNHFVFGGGGLAPVPPWATNNPGGLYCVDGGGTQYFELFDYSTESWVDKQNLLGNDSGNALPVAWADYGGTEYVYLIRDDSNFDRYNTGTDTWTKVGAPPANLPQYYSGNAMVWDGDQFLFYVTTNGAVYRFDLNSQSWDSYVTLPSGDDSHVSIAYTPRIRFVILDTDGDPVYAPVSLGAVPKATTSAETCYYLKALEAEGGTVTLSIVDDDRFDADDLLQLAPDSGGQPGTWGTSVNLGSFSASQSKPFWVRTNTLSTTGQEAKVARLRVDVS